MRFWLHAVTNHITTSESKGAIYFLMRESAATNRPLQKKGKRGYLERVIKFDAGM